jgi:hypothetical protein
MNCRDVQATLWPGDLLRVSDAEVEKALEHAESCLACRRFIEEDSRVARLIQESVPKARAPRELRERLYTVLARERAGSSAPPVKPVAKRRQWLAVSMAVGAVLGLAATGSWLVVSGRTVSPATAFAEDFLRRVVEQEELRTNDHEQIATFFARELGVAMPPPEVPEFEVRRATICMMNGRRGGVVEYEGGGRQLTYYLIPKVDDGDGSPANLGVRSREYPQSTAPALAHERGVGVATWWDGEHRHALVGRLPTQQLKRLAPLFTCPTSRL